MNLENFKSYLYLGLLLSIAIMQARRQEFQEGGSSTRVAKRVALTAGGLGAAQGPQNPGVFGAKS